MRYTISQARAALGHLITRAQDPREVIVLTRRGKPQAALVSIAEAERIWDLSDAQTMGGRHPLSGLRGWWSRGRGIAGMEPGPDGTYVTAREAALQMQDIQRSRAEERRILTKGGLDPVEGGELMQRTEQRWWARLVGRG